MDSRRLGNWRCVERNGEALIGIAIIPTTLVSLLIEGMIGRSETLFRQGMCPVVRSQNLDQITTVRGKE